MSWIETSVPSALPISLSELKASLRVTYTEEDALLQMYAKAATHIVETKTGRALINRTAKLELPYFPDDDCPILIPRAPLVSVQSIQYYDGSDTLTTWNASNYLVDLTSLRPKIYVRDGQTYPVTDDRFDAVTVNFTIGYGETFNSVPEGLRFIVMALTSHYFLNRAPVIVGGGSAMDIPKTLDFAMDAYRIHEA